MTKQLNTYLLPFLLFITLSFPVAQTTDWGSDFAHYVHQAENIVEGIEQQDNGFIINDGCAEISPQAYTIGFPLLLSIIYYFQDYDVASFIYLQTLFLSFIGFFLFRILLKTNGLFISLLGAALFVYAPYTIWFRNQILSEYSYIFFQMLFLLIYWNSKSRYKWIALGLILGYAWSIRSTALAIPIAIIISEGIKLYKNKGSLVVYEYLGKSFQFHALTFLLAFGVYKLLNTLLFDVGDNTTFHLGIYKNNFTSDTVLNNFKYYLTQIFESYFQFWQIPWIGTAACIMFIVLFIRGWGKLKGRYKLIYYILIVQFIMIIFFPFQQGMRYMLPLVPLVIIVVLKSFDLELNRDGGLKYLFLGILGLFFFSNLKGISQVNQYVGESPTWSPSTEQTVEGWDYINEYVDEESVFISAFPRVLTFYTDVNAYNPCVSDNNKIWDDIRRFNTTHIITNVQTNQWVPTLENFIKSNTPVLDTLFINDEVLILKIDNK